MTTQPIVESKSVKHVFLPEERNVIGSDLARSIAGLRGIEAEFDQVKASYKAKTTEAEARIDNLSTSLMNGFEMRTCRCRVAFRPKDRKKDYFLEEAPEDASPVLIEDMTPADFQAELIQAESKFDNRVEIPLFQSAGTDYGTLIVGKFGDKWFSALRIQIGKLSLNERLDSEQKCYKERIDAIRTAVGNAKKWAKDNLRDLAKGFADPMDAVIEAEKDKVE